MIRNPTILFRVGSRTSERDEFAAARRHMRAETSRCLCRDATVFGRYSVLPWYEDLEQDMAILGSRLINSYDQHRWIADFRYYEAVRPYTFPTWTEDQFPRSDDLGPFVIKGTTNSKKYNWNTLMFARDRREAIEVAARLRQDDLIGRQKLIYRKYVPLLTYEVGLNDLRFTNEWRLFFLGRQLIAHGYYWTEAEDVVSPSFPAEAMAFAQGIADIVSRHVNFFVLDVGEREKRGWILIEINDGQMSGLSMIDPDVFYQGLSEAARAFTWP